jgi:hypothetical protein
MSIVRWEDPPPAGGPGRPHEWQGLAGVLRHVPKRWALVEVVDNSQTAANHARAIRSLPPRGAFEAMSRHVAEGYCVYARYVGGVAQ